MTPRNVTLWEAGRRKLLRDPAFRAVVRASGPIRYPRSREHPFDYLSRSIIYQQLAGAAAATIHGRFVEALKGEVTPAKVLRVRESTLRRAGLSAAKAAAVRDLARKVRDGTVEVEDLDAQPDDEVVARLTKVRGIGPWTAHMFLMFRLHRPDVWPVGDLGVRQGYAQLHGLDTLPTPKELAERGAPYRPWRSAAAWYCYRALDTEY